ncbi:tRNA (adenine(37)-N6)-methyltransferase isoform X2 [Pristis pectinata]|uniref:tRNA (adenine(37)-N6)-methyltransferase isoform X2 n=1 Tax=Pristis pectinata TaxID=685728 RepID=UPI00223D1E88|nr:tRNA (adenine(37)-N6)-methyltransferase isoform X2 [Pristis pectinata]
MDVTGSAAVRAQLLLGQACALRAELKNLRQDVNKAVRVHKKSIEDLRTLLHSLKREHIQDDVPIQNDDPNRNQVSLSLEKGSIQTTPIGYIESCFSAKNGTPRQPTVCSLSRARLKISKTIFTNADHSLMGLEQFSHVWIIFIFHKNGHQGYKAKVKPPRLNGLKTGVFSTRSPHRPNAIGLTLGKLDRIEGDTLYLSGIDMIQGTPVLDIKPYIPDYDTPGVDPMDNINDSQEICVTDEQCQGITNPISGVVTEESEDKESAHVKVASKIACDYVTDGVEHSPKDATNPFRKTKDPDKITLKYFHSIEEIKSAMVAVLSADPRSIYRRMQCQDMLFYFTLDTAHITTWFGDDFTEILRIKPVKEESDIGTINV